MPAAASARLPTADGSLVGVSVGNVAPAWQKPSRAKKAAGIFGRACFRSLLFPLLASYAISDSGQQREQDPGFRPAARFSPPFTPLAKMLLWTADTWQGRH
jgi:hypothetical protein